MTPSYWFSGPLPSPGTGRAPRNQWAHTRVRILFSRATSEEGSGGKHPESKQTCFLWAAPLQTCSTGERRRWQRVAFVTLAAAGDREEEQPPNLHHFHPGAGRSDSLPDITDVGCARLVRKPRLCGCVSSYSSHRPCAAGWRQGELLWPPTAFRTAAGVSHAGRRAALYPRYSHNAITMCTIKFSLVGLLPDKFIVFN